MKLSAILFILMLIFGCGKSDKTNTTKVRFLNAASFNSANIPQEGGFIFMGKNTSNNKGFRIGIPWGQVPPPIELEQGPWEFMAIAWDGSGGTAIKNFYGTNKCAVLEKDLKNPEENIDLNFNTLNCTADSPSTGNKIARALFRSSAQFYPIEVHSCFDFNSGFPIAPASCPTNGLSQSMKIVFDGNIDQFGSSSPLMGLDSECVAFSGGVATTNLKFPISQIANFKIILFADNAICSGSGVTYDLNFTNSLSQSSGTFKYSAQPYMTTTSMIYLEHNEETEKLALGKDGKYGFGNDGDPASGTDFTSRFSRVRINDIPDPLTIKVPAGAFSFNPGDEIAFYVTEDQSGSDCGLDTTSKPLPGMFWTKRIQDVPDDQTILLKKPFSEYFSAVDNSTHILEIPSSASLAAIPGCAIQVVKVPNFQNISSSIVTILNLPDAYNTATSLGGFYMFRVNGALDLNVANLTINAPQGYAEQFSETSPCHSWAVCAKMGDGSVSSGGGNGRGVIIPYIRNIEGANNLILNAYETANQNDAVKSSKGGTVILKAGRINSTGQVILDADGSNNAGAGGSGDGGRSQIFYCEKSNASILSVSATYGTTGTPPGSPGVASVSQLSDLCF